MEDELHTIRVWAGHGTPRQFMTELSAKIASHGYEAKLEGDTLICYKVSKMGGFLGIGKRNNAEVVLKIVFGPEGTQISPESANADFVHLLKTLFKQH